MRVLVYGFGKSGTTAVFHRVKKAMEVKYNRVQEIFEPESRTGDTFHKANGRHFEMEEVVLVKTLHPDSGGKPISAEQVIQTYGDFDKVLMVVRDPRDRALSKFFYYWNNAHHRDESLYKEALRLTLQKERDPSSVPFHKLFELTQSEVSNWPTVQTQMYHEFSQITRLAESKGWHTVRYEDFIDGRLGDLQDYLGFPLSGENSVDRRFTHVARSVGYGNWRKWYTAEDVDFYRPIYSEYLQAEGYDAEDWNLESVDSLPSENASQYMRKLHEGHHHHHHGRKQSRKKWYQFWKR